MNDERVTQPEQNVDPLKPPDSWRPELPARPRVSMLRETFWVGLLAGLVLIGLLLFLWLGARSDRDAAETRLSSDAAPSGITDPTGEVFADPAADGDADGTEDGAEVDVESLQAEGDQLREEAAAATDAMAALQAQLDALGPPALPGTMLKRIPIPAGSRFLSVGTTGVSTIASGGAYTGIDPATNTVTGAFPTGSEGSRILRTDSAVWITDHNNNQLRRVDPTTNQVVATITVEQPDDLAKFGASIVVGSTDGQVVQIDPGGAELARFELGGSVGGLLVAEDGSIWAALFQTGELVHIDGATFTEIARYPTAVGGTDLAEAYGSIWLSAEAEGLVQRIDYVTGEVQAEIEVGTSPAGITAALDRIWVAVTGEAALKSIDPNNNQIETSTPIGGRPFGIDHDETSVWVAIDGDLSVVRVTPS